MKTEFKILLDKCGLNAASLTRLLQESKGFELLSHKIVRDWCAGNTKPWPSAVRKLKAQLRATNRNFRKEP